MPQQTLVDGEHIRGAKVGSKAVVIEEMEDLLSEGDPGIFWGGLRIPSEDGPRHFCVMGATGSGKTVLLRLLMQSVLPLIGSGASHLQNKPREQKNKSTPTDSQNDGTAGSQTKSPAKTSNNRSLLDPKDLPKSQHFLRLLCTLLFTSMLAYLVFARVDSSRTNRELTILCFDAPLVLFPLFWFISRKTSFGLSSVIAMMAVSVSFAFGFVRNVSDGGTILKYGGGLLLAGYFLWIWIHDRVKAVGAFFLLFALFADYAWMLNTVLHDSSTNPLNPSVPIVSSLLGLALYYHPVVMNYLFDSSSFPEVRSSASSAKSDPKTIAVPNARKATPSASPSKYRALIYDAKQDAASLIRAIHPKCAVVILNPFDTRCAAWDMAKDITKPSTADQIASILIPDNKAASQPFFANAARQLLSGVFKALIILKPNDWDFRDVVLCTKTRESLSALLQETPYTKDLVKQYLSNATTADNILSELASYMGAYEHIAAAWSKATEKVSLTDWIKNEYILLLGNDEAHRTALDAVNQLLFQRLTEIVLSQPETTTEQTWIFLDEVREAGELEGLGRLLNKGRSKGACVVLGFQDMDGMRSVYGNEIANEIVGQCNHMAMLRINSPETAKWASERIGECETVDEETSVAENEGTSTQKGTNTGISRSPGWFFKPATSLDAGDSVTDGNEKGTTRTKNTKKIIKSAVLPSEFLHLPLTNRRNGLTGFFIVPQVRAGAYRAEIPASEIFPVDKKNAVLVGPDPNFPNFQERPPEDEYLLPFTEAEKKRFGLKVPVPSAAPSTPTADAPAREAETPIKNTPTNSPPEAPKVPMPRTIRETPSPPPPSDDPVPYASEEKTKRLQDILDRK